MQKRNQAKNSSTKKHKCLISNKIKILQKLSGTCDIFDYMKGYRKLLWVIFLVIPLWLRGQILEKNSCAAGKKAFYASFRSQERVERVPALFDITHMEAHWNLDPAQRFISGSVIFSFRALRASNYFPLELDEALVVDSVIAGGRPVSYQRPAGYDLHIEGQWAVGDTGSVRVHYHGVPPETGFGAFSLGSNSAGATLWTLSEPYGARDWWPAPQNLQDKIDSVDIFITVPAQYQTGSNGLLADLRDNGPNRIYHWRHRHPIAVYLVAVAVAVYDERRDTIELQEGPVLMQNLLYPEATGPAAQALTAFARHFQWLDSLLIPYPFRNEKYGHAQFGWGGGMEHQTMSFMGGFTFELMVHELAHQWFGDHITCASWRDIWLNEGFATYCTMLAYERFSPNQYWPVVLDQTIESVTSRPGGSVYVDDTSDVSRIFDSRLSYRKGAMLLHMLRWTLGDEAFFRALRAYLNDPDLASGFASTEDMKAHLESESGRDLEYFFDQWYYGEGYPEYFIKWKSDGNDLLLDIRQESSMPAGVSFFEMDLPVLASGPTRDTLLRIHHSRSGEQFRIALPFTTEKLEFDPQKWILSRNNEVLHVEETKWEIGYSLRDYPGRLRIWLSDPFREVELAVFDMQGRKMAAGRYGNQGLLSIDVSGWPSGVYVALLRSGSDEKALKIVLP